MRYRDLGPRGPVTGRIDNTGANPYGVGMWAVTFDPKVLMIAAQLVEVYHIVINGPPGSSVSLYRDTHPYSASARGDINEWDPVQPLPLNGGQSMILYWNVGVAPTPTAVAWCRLPGPI